MTCVSVWLRNGHDVTAPLAPTRVTTALMPAVQQPILLLATCRLEVAAARLSPFVKAIVVGLRRLLYDH